jgi:hypothetical protein
VPVKSTRPPKDSPKKTTGRWKNRNISSSKRMKRKIRRNHSAPYVSDTRRRNILGREVGPPYKCERSRCQSLLQGRELNIFNNFRNLGNINIQSACLLY